MGATLSTLAVSTLLAVLSGGMSAGDLGMVGGLAVATILGILGITDFLIGGDDEDGDVDEADAVFDDDGDDMDGLGGFDDDGLDGFDDGGDALGGGGTGTDTSELENRLDELENEVANLSSTVNTVQSENEAVSETVGDIEENVRDLLEIYEMVTRGVNPFVDETASGAMGGDVGGDFGLFDGDDDEDEGDDVDDSIADADAEEFFEDDFDGPGGEEFADPDDAALLDDDGGMDDGGMDDGGMDDGEEFFEDDFGDDFDDFDEPSGEESAAPDDAMIPDDDGEMNDTFDDGGETDGDGGTSFEELKQEYEEGDPGWDVDDPVEDEPVDDLDDSVAEGEAEFDDAPPEEGFEDELDDTPPEEGVEDGLDDEEFEFIGEREDDDGIGGDGGDGRLHLQEFPGGYRADMTALEWLEYLIEVGGRGGARDALSYYVDVGWISPTVEDTLHAFLDGINVSDTDGGGSESGGLAQFDTDDHRKSLAYVARLAGDDDRAAVAQPDGSSADSIESPELTGGAAADGGSELAPTDDPDSRGGENGGV